MKDFIFLGYMALFMRFGGFQNHGGNCNMAIQLE